MSHIVKVKTKVKFDDPGTLERCLGVLKQVFGVECTLRQNASLSYYSGRSNQVYDYVLEASQMNYSVGFNYDGESYVPEYDDWGSSISKHLGKNLSRLGQAYHAQRVIDLALNQGYSIASLDYDSKTNEVHMEVYE